MIAVNSLERNRPLIFFKISFSSETEENIHNINSEGELINV